jgi:hypothetical protein
MPGLCHNAIFHSRPQAHGQKTADRGYLLRTHDTKSVSWLDSQRVSLFENIDGQILKSGKVAELPESGNQRITAI